MLTAFPLLLGAQISQKLHMRIAALGVGGAMVTLYVIISLFT